MVVHHPRERLRYNSERPTAIRDVLVATGPRSYRSCDVPLGTPTASARTRRGLWALYPVGEEVVVAHPGGAVAGPPGEVAAALDRLAAADGRDLLERQVVQALRGFLLAERPSRGEPARDDREARPRPVQPLALHGRRVRPRGPTPPEVAPEPAVRPAA
jgi:hypothetical protein